MDGWRGALLVACVLAAGCSAAAGVWSAPESTATLTPAPVPETPPVSAAAVPGVFANGSVDPVRLADAHARATAGRNYTWTARLRRTDGRTGHRVVDATRRARVDAEGTLVTDRGFPEFPANQTVYLTDRQAYRRLRGIGTSMRLDVTRVDRRYVFAESLLRFNLRAGDYRTRAVERDGVRSLRLEYPPNGSAPADEAGNYTATLFVTREGFVRRFSVGFTDLRGDRVSLRFRYTAVGTTAVSTPGWVARLRANASDGTVTPSPTTGPATGG